MLEMKIAHIHSHLGGFEFINVRYPAIWREIRALVEADLTASQRRHAAGHAGRQGHRHRARIFPFNELTSRFLRMGWTKGAAVNDRTSLHTEYSNAVGCPTANLGHMVGKDRIAVELQICHYLTAAFRHLARYVSDHIDVGVEILPMKSMQAQMSSGIAYYEGELYNLIREGRGVPAVPLVLIGVAP